jgi:hypothetical protein
MRRRVGLIRRAGALGVLAAMALGVLAGCMTRTIEITSEPSGALVTLNDVEVGRTPVRAEFTYYGVYDVLLTREGYEPLRTSARARAPVYELPPVDLAANAIPGATHTVRWHFVLEEALESRGDRAAMERDLLERARALRAKH